MTCTIPHVYPAMKYEVISYKMKGIVGHVLLVLASQSVFDPVKGKNLMLSFIWCVQFMEEGFMFC